MKLTLIDGTVLEGTVEEIETLTTKLATPSQTVVAPSLEKAFEDVKWEDAEIKPSLGVGDYARVIAEGNPAVKIGDIIRITEICSDGKRVKFTDVLGNEKKGAKRLENLVRATSEEVDKAKSLLDRPSLEVGDIVKGIKGNGYYITNEKMTKGKVVAVYSSEAIRVEVLEHATKRDKIGQGYNVDPSLFEKITVGFQAGDKVRLIDGGGDHPLHGYENGKIYTIKALPSEHSFHRRENLIQITGGEQRSGFAKFDQLELVDEPLKQKFEVGSKVKLIDGGESYPLNGYDNGEIYTIEAMPDEHPYHKGKNLIQITGGRVSEGYAREDQLELITEAVSQPQKFEVGDFAKVISVCSGEFNTKVGDIVEITKVVSGDFIGYKILQNGNRSGMLAKRFVKATAKEVSLAKEPKVGDTLTDGGVVIAVRPTRSLVDGRQFISHETGLTYITIDGREWWTQINGCKVEKRGTQADADAALKRALEKVSAKTTVSTVSTSKPKFNVGDDVKLMISKGATPHYGWGAVKNGDEGRVVSVEGNHLVVNFPAQRRWNGKFDEFILVTKGESEAVEEVKQTYSFRVGDKVKLTIAKGKRPSHGWGSVENGDEGTVASINGSSLHVDFPKQSRWLGHVSEFTLVSEEVTEAVAPEIKVDDLVRIINRKHGHRFPIGEIVRISLVGGGNYKAEYLDGHDYWYVNDDEIEKVEEKAQFKIGDTARIKQLSNTLHGFKVGQIVTLHENRVGRADFMIMSLDGERRGFTDADNLESVDARKDVIEQAKADVKSLEGSLGYGSSFQKYDLPGHQIVKFEVNKQKRTVVALIQNKYMYGGVNRRGVAKCNPDDTFNVHIGKAIALRRALGLTIPSEFVKAAAPTELGVGDIVQFKTGFGNSYKITAVHGDDVYDFMHTEIGQDYLGLHYENLISKVVVLDDSKQ